MMLPPVSFSASLASVAAFVALLAPAAGAQQTLTAQLPQATACDMRFALVSFAAVDAAGKPVTGATVEVKGDGPDGALVHAGGATKPGDSPSLAVAGDAGRYILADDSDKARLSRARAGEWFTVMVTNGARMGRARVRLGLTQPGGCHVSRLSGPDTIVVR